MNETWYDDRLGITERKQAIRDAKQTARSTGTAFDQKTFAQNYDTGGIKLAPVDSTTYIPAPATQGGVLPSGVATVPAAQAPAATDSGFNFGEFISGIPPTVLYIGIAIGAYLVLKKR